MTEELKNAMRNATDEILMTLDKCRPSEEDRKKIIENLGILLAKQDQVIYKENKEREAMKTERDEGKLYFDFATALDALRDNAKVTRLGWNGKGMWVEMQVPDEHSKMTKPYLYLNYPDNQRVPWSPSQTDILATDWYEVK